jgi:hypothetical protein
MYMNMYIVMNMNIYIRPDLEQRLRKEASMSGLINKLLDQHYTPLPPNSKTIKQKQEPKNILEPKLSFKSKQSFKPKQSFEAKPIITEIEKDFDFCKNGHPMKGDKCFGKGCKYN